MNIIDLIKIIREVKVLLDHFREDPEFNKKLLLDQQIFIEIDKIKPNSK